MSVATFTKTGTKATAAAKLPKEVFGVEIKNHELLKAAYVAYMANGRTNNAKVKNRGDVSGGGRKPWRQKGTGRARFGSSRVPQWRHGGIVFGPTGDENYSKKINISSKRQALRQALTMAANDGKLIIIEDIVAKEASTKAVVSLLNKIGVERSSLIIVEARTPEIEKSLRNVSDVTLKTAKYLNVFDILNAHHVVITEGALQIINEWLGGKA